MAWPENINPQRLRRPTNPLGIGVSLDFSGISIRHFSLEIQRVTTWRKPGNPVFISNDNPQATRMCHASLKIDENLSRNRIVRTHWLGSQRLFP
jgi:hypothetical protein